MDVEDFMLKVAKRLKSKADEMSETAKALTESDKEVSRLFGAMMYLRTNTLYDIVIAILETIEEMKK